MGKKVKKRKLKTGRILTTIVVLVLVFFVIPKVIKFTESKIINKEYYVADSINMVPIYSYDEDNNKMIKEKDIYRGIKVKSHDKTKKIDDITYIQIVIYDKRRVWCRNCTDRYRRI